ncbi:MAG: hypothetical protein A2270_00240 [Elusimicrobia bacterium RIFOXYA12_FULL_51_18]|nr:MAG: hypothetical protein A2270_00240 [Elusimicrobia bacterium RIFOXYA12_FULL_51_18]OGS31525.1 MAG: hypothetical protein A2218_09710 [Elusimicrobia bacterium RIFOXYA2_FULL_53_38]
MKKLKVEEHSVDKTLFPLIALVVTISAFAIARSWKSNPPSDFRDAVGEESQEFNTAIPANIASYAGISTPEAAVEIPLLPGKIIGGIDAVKGEFPFMVLIVSQQGDQLEMCGGSLIRKNWVLTAGHCVNGNVKAAFVGAHDLRELKQTVGIERFSPSEVIRHPNYNSNTGLVDYDFALLRLNGESKFPPISLNRGELSGKIALTIAGWGLTKEGGQPSNILKTVSVPLVSEEKCRKDWPEFTARMLCGGSNKKGAFHGDSGGPVFIGSGPNTTLVGVVSGGGPGKYTLYGKVSSIISWTDSIVDAAGDESDVEWVRIKGGSFIMGSNDTGNTSPAHTVYIGTFEISKTVVTVEQYAKCVSKGKCSKPKPNDAYCNWGVEGRELHPINCVDWDQANQYAGFKGARLPSEAQWEYAATSGGKNRLYPWGYAAATCDKAVIGGGCGNESTMPVCSKTAGNTEQGLCDMAGNVGQWVQDAYSYGYFLAPNDGTAYECFGSNRVVRGSSFAQSDTHMQVYYRDDMFPVSGYGGVGFRIVRPSR